LAGADATAVYPTTGTSLSVNDGSLTAQTLEARNTFTQTGGYVSVTNFSVGAPASKSATATFGGGAFFSAGTMAVGAESGAANVVINSGAFVNAGGAYVFNSGTSPSPLTIHGGTFTSNELYVSSHVKQDGGDAMVFSEMTLEGYDLGAGTYDLSDGTLTSNRVVGGGVANSQGTFTQSGGTHTIGPNSIPNTVALEICGSVTSTGSYNLQVGTLNVLGDVDVHGNFNPQQVQQWAALNIAGGTMNVRERCPSVAPPAMPR
jgi:hypothetical protein